MRQSYLTMFFVCFCLTFSSCKQEDESKLDLLVGGGSGSSDADQLEITSKLPDQSDVTIEIGDTQIFSVTAVAPFPSVPSYSWTYDGTLVSASNNYSITGALADVGNHTLIVKVTDGDVTKQNIWNVKVNGPPVVTNITTGTPAVSYDATVNLSASASDPNGDSLTYTWLFNGAPSSLLVGSGGTATLSGDPLSIGAGTVTVEVSDGTKSDSYTWNVEMNYFPQACNELSTGEICTYSGGAHKGNGLAANNTQYPLRFLPFTQTQDAIGNFFISDLDNNVVWYWNRTGAAVTRIGQTIPAGVIQVVAGTGEDSTGSAGISAITSPLNNPRGLWYDDAIDRLYIAENQGNQIKYVDTAGTVFVGMGAGASHSDGDTAFTHDCDAPQHISHYAGSLYVACYNEHRVKRWDLTTGLAYTVAGDGGADDAGENTPATSSGVRRPYGLFVDANGIYVTLYDRNHVRFVNTTGAAITFWNGQPSQVTINPGNIASIMGDGGQGGTPTSGDPLSNDLGNPNAVWVRNGDEIYVGNFRSDDIVMGNNSGGPITIDGLTINHGKMGRINHASAGYNGSSSGVTTTRFNNPYSLSIDRIDNDKLIVSDYSNYRVREIDLSNGDVSELLGSGRGKSGFYGDTPQPGFEHLFVYPTGLAFDDTNRILFFADSNNHRLRQVSPYGVTSTAAGRGNGDPTIDNDFPNNILIRSNYSGTNSVNNSFDILPDGSLAQLNSYGHNVRLWNRSGADNTYFGQFIQNDRVSTIAGDWVSGAGDGPTGPALSAQMRYPNSIKFYNNGGSNEMFIADTMNHCIRHVDATGNLTTAIGLCGTAGDPGNDVPEASARFNRPRGIAVDTNGNLFISDYNNHHIWYWNRTASPVSIGTITVGANRIAVVACLSGSSGNSAEGVAVATARCNTPSGLDLNGNEICYAQRNRHNVRCFDRTTGIVRTVAGRLEAQPRGGSTFDYTQEGISATTATLLYPSSITFDSNGDLYISDTYNHVIRKVKLSP